MDYTQIPDDAFEHIQRNAGILCTEFDPETRVYDGQIGVTSGGVSFEVSPTYVDFGDDMDNCPKNAMELKELQSVEAKLSCTFNAADSPQVKRLVGAADISTLDSGVKKITPRYELTTKDFENIWLVCDYGQGGFIAIKVKNCLSTGGFKIQTTDREKGTFDAEFTAHTSLESQDELPYEIYIVDTAAQE